MPKFITNSGQERHLEILSSLIKEATFARLADACVKLTGIRALLQANPEVLKRGGQIRLVTTSDFQLTDSQALAALLDAGVVVKVFGSETASTFHPKFYLSSYSESRFALLVGSANLTEGGLTTNTEASLLWEGGADDPVISQAYDFFSQVWNHPASILIDEDYVREYSKVVQRYNRRGAVAATRLMRELNRQYRQESESKERNGERNARDLRVIDMCLAVFRPGEVLHYKEVTRRVLHRFRAREWGKTPEASIRRDLNYYSTRHPETGRILFRALGSGLYQLMPGIDKE